MKDTESIPTTKRLDVILNAGIGVSENGDIRDSKNHPAGRKYLEKEASPSRLNFSSDDDKLLLHWVGQARDQHLAIRHKIFADLESVVSFTIV